MKGQSVVTVTTNLARSFFMYQLRACFGWVLVLSLKKLQEC